jgi:hypothetical protein
MNKFEHQSVQANEQLRQALDGFAGLFETLLRRSSECAAEIEAARGRQQAEAERMIALEQTLAADRATLQQLGGVFAEVARRSGASAPAAPPAPAAAKPAPSEPATSFRFPAPAGPAATKEPEPVMAAVTNGRTSSLTAADLMGITKQPPRDELAD